MNFNYYLPKWPQLIITGTPVTVEQAKDIIFRTDAFLTDNSEYSGGNTRKFNKQYRKKCGFIDSVDHSFAQSLKEMQQVEAIRERIGFINAEYIRSDYASSCYIGGPNGFCSPSGHIHHTKNIGKYPSVEEVYNDFVLIAQAWPFLDMKASLYDGESCEENTKCVVSFIIKDGTVQLVEEDFDLKNVVECNELNIIDLLCHTHSGLGLPDDWYDEFAAKVKQIVNELESKECPL